MSHDRPVGCMSGRSGRDSALIMAHQVDLFWVPQLADTECLEADHRRFMRLLV
jgi:hypothetical protein